MKRALVSQWLKSSRNWRWQPEVQSITPLRRGMGTVSFPTCSPAFPLSHLPIFPAYMTGISKLLISQTSQLQITRDFPLFFLSELLPSLKNFHFQILTLLSPHFGPSLLLPITLFSITQFNVLYGIHHQKLSCSFICLLFVGGVLFSLIRM